MADARDRQDHAAEERPTPRAERLLAEIQAAIQARVDEAIHRACCGTGS